MAIIEPEALNWRQFDVAITSSYLLPDLWIYYRIYGGTFIAAPHMRRNACHLDAVS